MLKITNLLFAVILILIGKISLVAQVTDKDFKISKAHFAMPDNIQSTEYISKTVIIKIKPEYRSICSANAIEDPIFKQLYTSIGGTGLVKKFPFSPAPASLVNRYGQHLADLSLIYEFSYSASVSLEKVINKFADLSLSQYAEPHYIPHLDYTPNDPLLPTNQYAITNIKAENAWGINTTTARGDTNIVIGIVDTGTEPTHEDLKTQIKHNYADKIGGGDTDADGYVDNFSGWDLGMNDNDPTWEGSAHGVHTSGIAAAAVDNAKGVAGIGFKCKFLPVKIADATGALTKGYEGITYAADHGCSIISCSWGGPYFSQSAQDVITYATINKNALVIASAGNTNKDEIQYPSGYQYVICVANTRQDDRRSTSSTYNYSVDISAPGEAIRSTYSGNTYADLTGTSMSAPCVAGAAAIVHAFYPSYNALQIGERLKATTYNNYPLMNPSFKDKMGTGRLDLYQALTNTLKPSVVTTQRNTVDNNDNTFVIGDTLVIKDTYINYLAATTNLTATLSTTSTYVTILSNAATLGAVGMMGTANNNATPYKVRILSTAPLNQPIVFKLTFSDASTSYTAVEYFTVIVNVDYINITINDVATTVNSRGRIGYNMDGQIGGLGFNYMNKGTILYEGGLMVGTDTGKVSDAIRGFTTAPENEFQSMANVRRIAPAVVSEFDVDGTFNDNLAKIPLKIKVHHNAYAWTTVGDRKYVIVQYIITNTGTSALSNLYAGIFADWDIDAVTFKENRTGFDATNKMGYAYYTGANGTYAGVKLLTKTAPVLNYAMDNVAGGAGGVDAYTNGLNGSEKYTALSTSRNNAGVAGTGADILDVVSTGPYTIAAGDSIKVAFALIAGDNLPDIKTSAVNAQIKYDGILTPTGITNSIMNNTDAFAVYPNPTNGESIIDVVIAETATVQLVVYDLLGKEIKTIASERMQEGAHRFVFDASVLSNGLYYYQLTVDNKKYVHKLIVNK